MDYDKLLKIATEFENQANVKTNENTFNVLYSIAQRGMLDSSYMHMLERELTSVDMLEIWLTNKAAKYLMRRRNPNELYKPIDIKLLEKEQDRLYTEYESAFIEFERKPDAPWSDVHAFLSANRSDKYHNMIRAIEDAKYDRAKK